MLLAVQDSERLQLRSLDLECQLSSKEKELESLFQKQKKVRGYSQPGTTSVQPYSTAENYSHYSKKLSLHLLDRKNPPYQPLCAYREVGRGF